MNIAKEAMKKQFDKKRRNLQEEKEPTRIEGWKKCVVGG